MNTKNNFYQIKILDASAGSGKTYNLSKHYVRLLFTAKDKQINIANILAITFTNKAAIEMKQRILDILKNIALRNIQNPEISEIVNSIKLHTNLNEEEIIVLSDKIISTILSNYHNFQVQTIDSFLHLIASVYALQLGISPLFKTETEYTKFLHYGIDYLLDLSIENPNIKQDFERFLDTYLKLENRRSWFPKDDIIKIMNLLFNNTRIYGKNFYYDKQNQQSEQIKQLSKKLILHIQTFLQKVNRIGINKNFINSIKNFIDNHKDVDIVIIKNIPKTFLKKNIPVNKGFSVSSYEQKLWKEIKALITELCIKQSFELHNCYIKIFNRLEKIIDETLKEQDIILLHELNKKINQLMRSTKYFVPDFYIRMATTIQHCLIDEFQDTSILQWYNLVPIIEEILANGGDFFYVGDKKQSIYRFRGSDYTLFDSVPTKYFPSYEYEKENLVINRRSKKEIVEFVNQIFSKNNLARFVDNIDDENCNKSVIKKELLKIYSTSQQKFLERNIGGYVYGELINTAENKDYNEVIKNKVISIITNIRRRDEKKQIAVLVRTNKEVETVSEWLLEHNFAVESDKTLDIQKNPFVKEIISLLKFLILPEDNLFFASFILGKIFNFVFTSEKKDCDLRSFIFHAKKSNCLLYKKFKEEYPEIWDKYFEKLFSIVKFLPTYDILIKIYNIFNLEQNPFFQNNYPFYYHLLELAKFFEQENCSIKDFIEKFETLPEEKRNIVAKGENEITVMTIHKSKGLEFDIVILPFVNIEIEVGKQKETNIKYVIIEDKNKLRIVRIDKNLVSFSKKLQKVYNEEYKKLLIDELNILYVAITRAKQKVFFFVPDDKNNIAKFIFPWDETNKIIRGQLDTSISNDTEKLKEQQTNMLFLPPIKHKEWFNSLIEPRTEKDELANRERIIEGEIIHKILSFINNLYNKNVEKEINIAVKKTKIFYPWISKNIWNKYKKEIISLLKNKNLQHLFFIEDGTVLCEQEFVSSSGEIYRIDRLIIKENQIIIVDYKLTFHKNIEDYKTQVEKYKTIVSNIYNQKSTIGYILFIDTKNLVKV